MQVKSWLLTPKAILKSRKFIASSITALQSRWDRLKLFLGWQPWFRNRQVIWWRRIDVTTMMAFQEGKTQSSNNPHFHVRRKKSRRISSDKNLPLLKRVDKQIEPPRRIITSVQQQHFDEKKLMALYYAWIIARFNTSFEPITPIFSGFMTNLCKTTELVLRKTVETYLLPINSKL